jgi:exodeoxyribonuclease-3
MLRVITLNLNGVRSATAKGWLKWLGRQKADVVCVQELKAQDCDLTDPIRKPRNLIGNFHCARKKGYSGVGVYTRSAPDRVEAGLGIDDIDAEGRYLQVDLGNLSVISVYFPSGSSSPQRQQAKFRFMEHFFPHLVKLRACGRDILLCGDWKNSGFLPEERAWLTRVFDDLEFVDVFRRLDPRPERYTWWSNRGQAWAKNVGWRIDYQIATPGLAERARAAKIYTAARFSDHAPLTIEFDHVF